jgi:CubicO group peptidase (beta-lactamase class C family)
MISGIGLTYGLTKCILRKLFRVYIFLLSFYAIQVTAFGQIIKHDSRQSEYLDMNVTLNSAAQDSTMYTNVMNFLVSMEHGIHSILLVHNNKLTLEKYFEGYSFDQIHDLRSVTKSIISLLLGIAIDQGFIESADDPISKYISQPIPRKNIDERKKSITIHHLLTMSTGLDCNDWDKKSKGQEDRVYRKKDWLQYTMDLPMPRSPGDTALYCSMGTVLAAEVVSQASALTIDEFANRYLFEPLGIENVSWGHTTKGRHIIPSAKRLYMTPRDMVKIGQLVLDEGKWGEKQIISSSWVRESTRPHMKLANMDYGYLWWNIPFIVNDQRVSSVVATGNGGQYIMIFPTQNMIAVFTGGAYNSEEDKLPFAIVNKIILPMIINK